MEQIVKSFPNNEAKYSVNVACEQAKQKDGRFLQLFKLEIKDEAEAKAKSNLSHYRHNLQGGRNFSPQFQYSSAGIAKISAIRKKHVSLKPNV